MLWTAPPPAREWHEGGVLLRPLRLEGANHPDDHNFRKLIADRVAKCNGTWQHKDDENAAPEKSGAVIRWPCGDHCQDNGKGGCGSMPNRINQARARALPQWSSPASLANDK
jgi:hypothetical protein